MADAAAMSRFAKGGGMDDEDELPEEPEPETGEEEQESSGRSDEEMEEIIGLVRENLQQIEEAALSIPDEELFELDEEMPEEASDAILAALAGMPAELGDELYNLDEADAQTVAEAVEEDLESADMEQVAAFLYQAGRLVTPGSSARSGDITPVKE